MQDNEQIYLYIKEEIEALASKQHDEIECVASDTMQQIKEEAKYKASKIFEGKKQREMITIKNDVALYLASKEADYTKEIIQKRTKLVDQLFEVVIENVKQYCTTKNYVETMMKEFDKIIDMYKLDDCTVFCNDTLLVESFNDKKCKLEVDPMIKVGGFNVRCNRRNIVVKNTFDDIIATKISEFSTKEELKIK